MWAAACEWVLECSRQQAPHCSASTARTTSGMPSSRAKGCVVLDTTALWPRSRAYAQLGRRPHRAVSQSFLLRLRACCHSSVGRRAAATACCCHSVLLPRLQPARSLSRPHRPSLHPSLVVGGGVRGVALGRNLRDDPREPFVHHREAVLHAVQQLLRVVRHGVLRRAPPRAVHRRRGR